MTLIVDTGPLFAHLDRDDRHHLACSRLLERWEGPVIIPQLVVAEATYFIDKKLNPTAEIRLLQDLASGAFGTAPVEPRDWLRIAELVWRYRDARLGTVDASAVALAERLGVTAIATLDHRHFGMVRPAHADAFELLP